MGTPQNNQGSPNAGDNDAIIKMATSKYRFIGQKLARGQTLSRDEADFKGAYDGLLALRAFQQGNAPAGSQNAAPPQHSGEPQEAEKPGFWVRLGQSFGLPTSRKEVNEMTAAEQALPWYQKVLPHQPGSSPTKTDSALQAVLGPVYPVVKGYGQTAVKGWKEGLQDAFDTGEELGRGDITPGQAAGKGGAAAMHMFLQSVPIVGPTLETYGQDIQQGNYRGAAGSALGFAGQVLGPKALKAAPRLAAIVPSAERASQLFNEVRIATGDVPVDVSKPAGTALEMDRVARAGGSMPPVAKDFLERVTDPNKPPLTYAEAKDFHSNASGLQKSSRQT